MLLELNCICLHLNFMPFFLVREVKSNETNLIDSPESESESESEREREREREKERERES